MAITQTHSRIKVAALGELNAAEKLAAENGAFYNDPMHAEAKAVLRELAITAPENINRFANETYDYLRQMRNVLSRPSITTADPEYRTASKPFLSSLGALQDAMRDDLRPGPRHHRKHVLSREVNRPREVFVPDLQIADEP